MQFLESPIFPGCPKFGYTTSILYSVDIVETAGGEEFRSLNWSEHRRTVQVTVGPLAGNDDEDVENVVEFYHVVGGTAGGFRVLDATDFKSCRSFGTPIMTDMPLVLISGSDYQLTKRYTQGSQFRDKSIYKPYGTILVASNGVLLTEGGGYTIDMTSGVVTTAAGGTLTWGGQYHIPCRFDSELPIELTARSNNRTFKTVTFSLKELRYEDD